MEIAWGGVGKRAQVVVEMFLGLRLGAHLPAARIP